MAKHQFRRIHLRQHEHWCLVEALRRRVCFNDLGKSITEQWTGLGTATDYKQAERRGYMVVATSPNPRHSTWWKLTPLGAAIVRQWLRKGYTPRNTEHGYGSPVNAQGESPPRCVTLRWPMR